jgi:hypothetical protein
MCNATSVSPGPIFLPHLMRAILTKRLTVRGFIVTDFSARYGDFMRDVSAWVREGRMKYREDVVEGLENAPRALASCAGRISANSWCELRAKPASDFAAAANAQKWFGIGRQAIGVRLVLRILFLRHCF